MFSRFFRKKEKSSPEIVVVHTTTASTGRRDATKDGRSEPHTTQLASTGSTNQHHHQHLHHQTVATSSSTSTTGASATDAGPAGASSTSPKTRLSFAAQFPPVDWKDPDYVNFHSRSTQTSVNREQQTTGSLINGVNNTQQHESLRHGIGQADGDRQRAPHSNAGSYHHHHAQHPSQQQQLVATAQLHDSHNSNNNQQLQPIRQEIPSRALSLARHCHTIRQSSCCSDATPEDSGAELSSRRRTSSRSNSRSTRHRRHCSVSDEVCCRHRSSSPPRRKSQTPRRLPPTLPGDVSPLQLRKTHPRYLPAPPNACKIPTLPPYPTSGLYRLNRPPLFPPAPPPNTDLFRQTERFRQHSSILFHSTDEDSPQLPRKAVISTEKEIKSVGTLGTLSGLNDNSRAQVSQVITTSPKTGSIRHTTTVTNDALSTSQLDHTNNMRNTTRSHQLPRYTGNAYLRSLNNNNTGNDASFNPLLCATTKEKCSTTTRTTTTISEKIDSSGNCTMTTNTKGTGANGDETNIDGIASSVRSGHTHLGYSGNAVNVCAPVAGDYKSIVDVNVVTDAAGRTVTNIKTSVCATPKGRESPQLPSAKVEKTKPELIIPADEKATSDTDLDAVDPPPEVSSTQATRFFENAASAAVVASAKTSASAGGNLSADDSGFLSTSPQPQSFVTTSS